MVTHLRRVQPGQGGRGQEQIGQVGHEGIHVLLVLRVEQRSGGALAGMADQASALQHVLGQRPAEHGLDVEHRQHARE